MAKINGTLIIFRADGSPIAHVESATLNLNRAINPSTDKDSGGWAEHTDETGERSWSIDVNGNADWVGATGNVKELTDILMGRKAVDIMFGGTAAGQVQYTGKASSENVTLEAPNEQDATLSGTFQGTGELSAATT